MSVLNATPEMEIAIARTKNGNILADFPPLFVKVGLRNALTAPSSYKTRPETPASGCRFVKAIKQGSVSISEKEVIEMSKMKIADMKEVSNLMAGKAWAYKKSRKFLSKMPDVDTKVASLISLCIAAGGTYEADIDGYKVTIAAKGKK